MCAAYSFVTALIETALSQEELGCGLRNLDTPTWIPTTKITLFGQNGNGTERQPFV